MPEKSARHSEKALRSTLDSSEAVQLYADLRYYGHHTIEDIVFNMFQRDETPLENFWEHESEFFADYNLLRDIARSSDQAAFVTLILEGKNSTMHRRCHCLYYFFESIPAYFDYEIALIELGYPCASAA